METKVKEKLEEFLDILEEYYGELEGLEIKISHPISDGVKQGFAQIDSVVIYHIHKTELLK